MHCYKYLFSVHPSNSGMYDESQYQTNFGPPLAAQVHNLYNNVKHPSNAICKLGINGSCNAFYVCRSTIANGIPTSQVFCHIITGSHVLNLSRGREIDVNQSTERAFCPKNTYIWMLEAYFGPFGGVSKAYLGLFWAILGLFWSIFGLFGLLRGL